MSFIDFVDLFLRLDGSVVVGGASVLLVLLPNHQIIYATLSTICACVVWRPIGKLNRNCEWETPSIHQCLLHACFLLFLVDECIELDKKERERESRGPSEVHERERGIVMHCFHEGSFNRIWQIETVATVDNERRALGRSSLTVWQWSTQSGRLELMQLHRRERRPSLLSLSLSPLQCQVTRSWFIRNRTVYSTLWGRYEYQRPLAHGWQ